MKKTIISAALLLGSLSLQAQQSVGFAGRLPPYGSAKQCSYRHRQEQHCHS